MENKLTPITVEVTIKVSVEKLWKLWTTPNNIIEWNNPSDKWHTPKVEIDLKDKGNFFFRMETKDGSFGFDHSGKYDKVIVNERIEYTTTEGRKSIIKFIPDGDEIILEETFEPETDTSLEKQKEFVQSILNNFKKYVENRT